MNDAPLLSDELRAQYLAVLRRDLAASKSFYFQEVMPRLRPIVEGDDRHREVRGKYETLVSLMGFSPETTVLATLIIRPQKLIVAYSDENRARAAAEPAMRYLVDEKILSQFDIQTIPIDAFDPADIYDKLRQHLHRAHPTTEQKKLFDITGGTKIMSATAGSLAWELNLDLCYLKSVWDPCSGSSDFRSATQLTLHKNPSRQRGYYNRNTALEFYRQGNFVAAKSYFETSLQLIDDPWLDWLGVSLCRCYQAVADFDNATVVEELKNLRERVALSALRSLVEQILMPDHLAALARLAEGDPLARTAVFLELSELYRRPGRYDFASLLLYRSMEFIVDIGLRRLHPEFSMSKPIYRLLGDEQKIREAFLALGRTSQGSLPPRLGLSDGFQLLCIVAKVHERYRGGVNQKDACGKIIQMAEKRNRSILAHGMTTLTPEDCDDIAVSVGDLAIAVLGDQIDDLNGLRKALRPRDLDSLAKTVTA